MKTPREIILSRSESATPMLDQIRRQVVEQTCGASHSSSAVQTLWRELFWPVRHIWLGLGAAWVVIFALTAGSGAMATRRTAPVVLGSDSVYVLQKKELLMAQAEQKETPAPPPLQPAGGRPRSEIHIKRKLV